MNGRCRRGLGEPAYAGLVGISCDGGRRAVVRV